MQLIAPLTEEQFLLLKTKMRQGPITIGGEMKEDGVTVSVYEKYSTQFMSSEEEDLEFGLLMPLGSICSLIAAESGTGMNEYLFGHVVRFGEYRVLQVSFAPIVAFFGI